MSTEEKMKDYDARLRNCEGRLIAGAKDFNYIKAELKELKSMIKPFISAKAAAAFGASLAGPIVAAIIALGGK